MMEDRSKKIRVERYYDLLKMIERSEKTFNETVTGSYIGVIRKLNVSHLKRQCWRPRNGSDRKNRRT